MSKPEPNSKTRNVSVRLDSAVADLLDEQAAGQGQDRSDFLRQLISTALAGDADDGGREELREELEALREALHAGLKRVREDVATLALGLVVTVGRQDPEKARAWVREQLEQRESVVPQGRGR